MKKRYLALPLLIGAAAVTWQPNGRHPVATAEELKSYTAPTPHDPRHPIDVFTVGLMGGETEGDVLAKLPAIIHPEDRIRFVVNPRWGLGTIVQIERALPVTIRDGKKLLAIRTWAWTVEELLAELDRPLGNLDRANVQAGDALTPNMTIVITRVVKTTLTQKEVIKFETIEEDEPSLYRGEVKVVEKGEKGERIKTFEITREDGEEVLRRLTENKVTKPPKNRLVLKGTKLKIGKTATGQATFYRSSRTRVASTTFRKGTALRLTNLANHRQIEVKVDDSGGFAPAIVVDLHPDLFTALGGTIGQGVINQVLAEEILNP